MPRIGLSAGRASSPASPPEAADCAFTPVPARPRTLNNMKRAASRRAGARYRSMFPPENVRRWCRYVGEPELRSLEVQKRQPPSLSSYTHVRGYSSLMIPLLFLLFSLLAG